MCRNVTISPLPAQVRRLRSSWIQEICIFCGPRPSITWVDTGIEPFFSFLVSQPWPCKFKDLKTFFFFVKRRGRLSMMNTSLMFEQYLNSPIWEKSQETFRKGFLLGNFSVRKCTQLTAHQPLLWFYSRRSQDLGSLPGSSRCHVRVGWGPASYLNKSMLGQTWAVTTLPTQEKKQVSQYSPWFVFLFVNSFYFLPRLLKLRFC